MSLNAKPERVRAAIVRLDRPALSAMGRAGGYAAAQKRAQRELEEEAHQALIDERLAREADANEEGYLPYES